MGGVGSGRRRKVESNGHNGHAPELAALGGPRVTFGQMFAKVHAAPAPPSTPDSILALAKEPPPPAPASSAPPERAGNRSFARMAGYVGVNVGVSVIGDHLRRKGLEPRDVAQEDLDRTIEATADAIVRGIGDMEVPWWAGLVAAWGNLYLAMRVGAKPARPPDATTEQAASSPATTTTTTPLGQALPPRPARPPTPAGGGLPPVEATGTA